MIYLWIIFLEILQGLIERYVPLCHNRNLKRARWPKTVLKLHRKQEQLHNLYKCTCYPEICVQYLTAARTACAAKRKARAEYEQKILDSRDMGTFLYMFDLYLRVRVQCRAS